MGARSFRSEAFKVVALESGRHYGGSSIDSIVATARDAVSNCIAHSMSRAAAGCDGLGPWLGTAPA